MSATLKALHATIRQAGLSDEDKRALYGRVTGKASAADMTGAEHKAVIDELKRLYPGLKGASKRADGRAKLTGKYASKLQALWIAGWNLGIVRNRDDAALEAFVKRQTGLDAVRFCHDPADAKRAIEALKGWLARDGGVQWGQRGKPDGRIIAEAQWVRFSQGADFAGQGATDFRNACLDLVNHSFLNDIGKDGWIIIMNALGKRIRDAKAKQARAA